MNIGILSKRTTMLTGRIKDYLENEGHNVSIYTLENLAINESLFNNDFYILKSKSLFFIYAGYYLEANDIPVIPDPHISFKQKNRIASHSLLKSVGFLAPDIYLGTLKVLKDQLESKDFPLILKPIMGSGSRGVKIIESIEELNNGNNKILYLEKYIEGIHYNVYFIDDVICTLVKAPLANEHTDMEKIKTPNDIKQLVEKWKNYLNGKVFLGHLDIVREHSSNKLYVVDPGSFPEFSNWKCSKSPVEHICNLILKQVKKYHNH
ncbi:MAG: RimK family alpha-L-glutamate ligase [Promethearchaeota archaeon]